MSTLFENEPGRLAVKFPNFPAGDYLVLDTDYENYAAVFSCSERQGLTAGVLTRENHPDPLIVSAFQTVFLNI